jgi:hypothetical protein
VSDLTPHPPVVDLLGMLAYAQLLAFDRTAMDARLAPDLTRRAMLSEMAGSEMAGFARLADRLRELGADPDQVMGPFRPPLDGYHDQTEPKDWLEALTKAYVGDGIADDFVREVARFLGPIDRDLVLDVIHDSRYADYAAAEIKSALEADPGARNRLSMWARRLVGEALRQAQRVAAERSTLAQLLAGAEDADVAGMFARLTQAHAARMEAVGLNN